MRELTEAEAEEVSERLTEADQHTLWQINVIQVCAEAWGDDALLEDAVQAARELCHEILARR